MKKISKKEIERLTVPLRTGRIAKCQLLYRELKAMKVGEFLFLGKKEWADFKYKESTSFRMWWSSVEGQKRKKHKSSLSNIKLEIRTFEEGWVITRLN